MPTDHKNVKINENALTKCERCDCCILSDSSDPQNNECIKFGEKEVYSSAEESNSNEGLVLKGKCQSTVKITVNGQCRRCDDDSSSKEKTSSSDTDNFSTKPQRSEFSMKHICFRFCRKKKPPVAADETEAKPQPQDSGNQTSQVAVNDTKTQMSNISFTDLVKQRCTCKPAGGGCNTNTIIFPRDKLMGDGIANLESFIRTEVRINSRNLEDILSELHKQRREIQEMKDMLEVIVRNIRDQLFMTFGKTKNGYHDLLEDMRKNNLERKSNTLSIVADEAKQTQEPKEEPPKQDTKKKRGIFSWCR